MHEFDSTNELERIYKAAIANKKKLNEAPITAPAPTKPATPVKPATPSPSTAPKPRDPFLPKPGQSPRPKALAEEEKNNSALNSFIAKRAKFIKK